MDWKVWKEIDVGTELEEYNKKLEVEVVVPLVEMEMTKEPELKIEEKEETNVEMKPIEPATENIEGGLKEEKSMEVDQSIAVSAEQEAVNTEAV